MAIKQYDKFKKDCLEDKHPKLKELYKKLSSVNCKITINKVREVESIEHNINVNLLIYLNNGREPNRKGGGSLYS